MLYIKNDIRVALQTRLTLEKRPGAHEHQQQESSRIHPYKVAVKVYEYLRLDSRNEVLKSVWTVEMTLCWNVAWVGQRCGKSERFPSPPVWECRWKQSVRPTRSRRGFWLVTTVPWGTVGNVDTPTSATRDGQQTKSIIVTRGEGVYLCKSCSDITLYSWRFIWHNPMSREI